MHRIGFIVPTDFQLMSLAALTAFEMANMSSGGKSYDIRLLSQDGGAIRTSSGFLVETEGFGEPIFDTVIVGSITAVEVTPATEQTIAFVRRASAASRRVASICTGAYVLAEAGLLDGRRATTHWAHADSFRKRFPDVQLEDDRIYVNDGPIWTSAGMTAGIDLVLGMVEQDLGIEVAKLAARLLVLHQRRLGGQRQHSALLDFTPKSDRIQAVLAHIRSHLRDTLTVDELASVARLSPRQFSRAFLDEMGQPPAKTVERLRLEAARFMLEEGRHSVNVIAQETGFGHRERMRRSFSRAFGLPPQSFRRPGEVESLNSETPALSKRRDG
jgi:transcriptional regulator GlxA family with amidase domain